MSKIVYLYDHHHEDWYLTDEYYTPTTCEICGDRDELLCVVESESELRKYLNIMEWDEEVINDIITEYRELLKGEY